VPIHIHPSSELPMRILRRSLHPLALLLALAAVPAAAQSADSALVTEARAFMDGYGNDLRTGDREAIAGRYDRRGVHFMFNGNREYAQWDSLAAQYRTSWRQPAAFEWRDLVYEPAGPESVVVNGNFLWTMAAGEQPVRFRYTALLVRREGALRIRLEDESMMAGPTPVEPN
jgi:hypothetical protein